MTQDARETSHLQPLEAPVALTLKRLGEERIGERIWTKDHTVWKPVPDEIADRLGWLDLVREPPVFDAELDALVKAVQAEGIRDVVLLGMGGSSLGAEALGSSFGAQPGYPRLWVLDSTHPAWVERVRRAIDPATTLFLVASKSGTTAEVNAFYHYFVAETRRAVGENAGRHFVAITDPGTPLADLALAQGFRATFVNPPDIGGRFSVLSRFGLVAVALAGIDPGQLLDRGHAMAMRCLPPGPLEDNPGLWLGAVLGTAAAAGRWHLTLLVSPRIAAFGLWVEQLIGESTGKEGKGILPITGEPLADPASYGDRRLFVALRLAGDPAPELEAQMEALRRAGQPLVELELTDPYDLGGEFFRWELATAVAGHLLGVQPFDQPDVQSTKTETRRVLEAYAASGQLQAVDTASDLAAALSQGPSPTYVAFMAYADQSAELEEAIAALRRRLLRDGLATTFGYGPRFLHSTGQLHKGGPDGGLFVQLVAESGRDLPIPGEPVSFGTLIQAQAAGDLAALTSQGRRTVRIDLGDDAAAGVRELVARLS